MAIKIAFWSRERACGTTVNMLLMAEFYAKRYPMAHVMIQQNGSWHSLSEETSLRTDPGTERVDGSKQKVMFVDCGNARDKKTYNSLKNADIVVENVAPTKERLESLILEKPPVSFQNHLFLIGNYQGEAEADREYFCHIYRRNEQTTGWVPYNSELEAALKRAALSGFFRRNWKTQTTERNARLFTEMERNLFLLAKLLEQKK